MDELLEIGFKHESHVSDNSMSKRIKTHALGNQFIDWVSLQDVGKEIELKGIKREWD